MENVRRAENPTLAERAAAIPVEDLSVDAEAVLEGEAGSVKPETGVNPASL